MADKSLTIVRGSLTDTAKVTGNSLAQTFLGVETVIIVDVSGSMAATDSRGGRQRYDVALEELAKLQEDNPGNYAILAFSDMTLFVPGGQPPFMAGGTDLTGALKFAQIADGTGVRFIVISDGDPNDPDSALEVAGQYEDRIDVIYVGDERYPSGRNFLQRLSAAAGGKIVTADRVNNLGAATRLLEAH